MNDSADSYTYRAGQKIVLSKSPDQMVVRALPDALDDSAISVSQQVSSGSTRVTTEASQLEDLMSRSRNIAPTHHAYYDAQTGDEFLISDRVFVTFKDAPTDEQLDEFSAHYGLLKKASYSDRDFLYQLTDHTGMNPIKLVVKLTEDDPAVEAAENDLNQRIEAKQYSQPLDPQYVRQWHLHTEFNHPDYDPRASALCEDAWQVLDNFGNSDIVVAVSDDGCKLDHQDFDSTGKFAAWGYLRGRRLINSDDIDADPQQMYKPGANHGTACAGVIAGEVDAKMTVGAAPACRLLPIQWQSDGPSLYISDSKLLTVLEYIADKADIMSNSWGGVPTSTWALPVINRIKELSRAGGRRGKGILFLWAAGNENCPINYSANEDVPYTDGVEVRGDSLVWVGVKTARSFRNNLVGIPGVMHIAALASTAKRSHYSNYGPGISLCAPSSNVHSYYRMQVRGLGVTTTTGEDSGVRSNFGGTSSATPLVAGVAALTLSANQDLTAHELEALLKQTAAKDLNLSGYEKTPPASFDPDTSWDVSPIAPFNSGAFSEVHDENGSWSPWFGYGRVNAVAAVSRAVELGQSNQPGGLTFENSASPNKSIPDNNPRGIKSNIECNDTFLVRSIKVGVDITHTYIGDLRVSLISPAGTNVVLHDRLGGSANDLHKEYTVSNVPHLQRLAGEPAKGNWTLQVQDLANIDHGRLVNWSLDIKGQAVQVASLCDQPGLIIPDITHGGIERSIHVEDRGQLQSIELDLDITHTYIGDLMVELISPSNTGLLLHNRVGGSANNIIKTYTEHNTSLLQTLLMEEINGDWRLKISDHASIDQGKLNHWALRLVYTQGDG